MGTAQSGERTGPLRQAQPADVAIVGLDCLLPKAPGVRRFWANLLNKVDAITDVPGERFNIGLYYDQERKARDKIYSRWGGFLEDVPFDPLRYGIPPNALASIDPMQLLSLVVVDRALRDAGYHDRDFPRETTSVIFGVSGGLGDLGVQYAVRATLPHLIGQTPEALLDRLPAWTEDSFAGILPNVVAGRIANRFNLGGVNFTVDAACASSLAAVYLAVRELNTGSSDMVITGGVDTGQSPFGYLCFSSAQALSPRGRCRTFDQSADGIAISEGLTVLVLKRLADAERDGDRIYAVIKGAAGSSDGRGRSMTAPRLEGQMSALRRAYQQAGLRPSTIGLIEAHGTGTAAGDATELAALSEVFRADGAGPHSCAIGSVKSQVGHTKSAAGVTSLMKAALALHHRVLPPTLHVEQPNPKLREPGSPFFVNSEPQPWISPSGPRRAGVSSFGFGGTNFHVVLEEYPAQPAASPSLEEWPAELFLWQAASPAALETVLAGFAGSLETARPLRELAAEVCRGAGGVSGVRLAVVASSLDDLKAKLAQAREALRQGRERLDDASGIYLAPAGPRRPVAFLFPGQGSQKPGMLRDLAAHLPRFREILEQADRVLAGRLPKQLSAYIYPPPAFLPEEEREHMQAITATVVAQPALGAVEIALARELERLGVRPDMTAGHSYGEYVALCAAGVFSEEALFRLSERRGRAIEDSVEGDAGTMAAASADAEAVALALNGAPDVWIANRNSPRQTVIAGSREGVRGGMERLAAAGVEVRPIPVACAFHSPLMKPARDRLAEALERETFASPCLEVFSNTLGEAYPSDPGRIRGLLAEHLVEPLQFTDEIRAMYNRGARVFVEVGPKGVLTGLARRILEGREARFIQMDSGDRPGLVSLVHALAQLAVEGVAVDAAQLFQGRVAGPSADAAPSVPEPGWVVNASRARPRTEPLVALDPVPLITPTPAASAPEPAPWMETMPKPMNPPAAAPAAAPADAVMLQFQQLMAQFLQTQAAVMTAYLQGATGETLAVPPVPLPAILPVAATAVPVIPPAPAAAPAVMPPPAAPPAPPAAQPLPRERDYARELLAIAGERTGYPPEMLNLDAGIEADLGIDSIKRVEILSAFQRLCTPDEQARIQAVMEQLTSARTLGEISNRIRTALGQAPSAPAAAAPAPAPVAAAPSPRRDTAAELLSIISERTGYPAEMLNLDAGIEADLGIDSIKRVEILSAFQRLCAADEQARVQAVMEQLTSARTLRDTIDRIQAALGQAQPAAASTPAPAPAAQPRPDIPATLLRIISERTGYPAEMLNLDAGIEADLGIDSIKRVEILSAFQRLCAADEQARVQAVMDQLTSARTLREIVNRLETALLPQTAPAARAAEVSAVPRFTLAAVAKPRRTGSPRYFPGRVVVITDDETGLAAGLAEHWAAAGERPVLLRHSPEPTLAVNGVISADLTDPSAVGGAMETIRREYGPAGALVHLLPLRPSPPRDGLETWRELVRRDVRSLYLLARAAEADLKRAGRDGGALLAVITGRGGDFGLSLAADASPTHDAVADFAKTVALELEGPRTKVVDLDASDPLPILRQKLIDELAADDDTLQVGLPGDRRLTVAPQHAPLGAPRLWTVGPDWVILLTGGARGITAEIARLLAGRQHPTLILAGASPLPGDERPDTAGITEPAKLKLALTARLRAAGAGVRPADVEVEYHRLLKGREIRETLAALQRAGSRVEYHAVDVRDEAAFGALLDRIYQAYGRLDMVVHGAGIIEDKLLKDKTPESFDRVVHTKADSAFLLSRRLRMESLQCLLFMSSITAAFGNRGQADYAAANGVLNGMARQLARQWPGRAVAMNWGPWDQSGMVSEEVRQQFLSRGVQLIPAVPGAETALAEVERSPRNEVVVALGGGPWAQTALASDGAHRPVRALESPV